MDEIFAYLAYGFAFGFGLVVGTSCAVLLGAALGARSLRKRKTEYVIETPTPKCSHGNDWDKCPVCRR